MNKAQKCQRWFTRLRQKGAWGDCGFVVIGRGVTHTHEFGSERHGDKRHPAEDQSLVARELPVQSWSDSNVIYDKII